MVPMSVPSAAAKDRPTGVPAEAAPAAWLQSRVPAGGMGASARGLLNYLLTHVSEAVYARASEVAEVANVSVSSVTRFAQQLGFSGWPDLQRNLRARYLSGLSLVDITEVHGASDSPFQNALSRDSAALSQAAKELDPHTVLRVAELLMRATQIHVMAMGSFAAVGQSFSHNLLLAGYPAHGLLDRDAQVANTVASLRDSDVVVVCSYWRHYRVVVQGAIAARSRGAKVIVIADYLPRALAPVADEVLLIPAEGTSFFASLTVPMAVQQGIMATLARIDPERTRNQLQAAEALWEDLDLLVDPHNG